MTGPTRYSIETHGVQDGIEGGAAATPQRGARVRATIESRPQAELAQLRSSRVEEGRTMLMSLCFSALLLGDATQGATLAPPPAAATGDAAAMLKEKLAKLSELKSYTFEALDDGAGMGGRGGRGGRRGGGEGGSGDAGGAPPAPTPTVGKVEIGKGVELMRGESLAYRRDTKMVYKKGDAWELYTAPEFGGGASGGRRGGGGEAGGGAGGPPAGGAGGPPGGGPGGGGDMRERFAVMGLASQVLPHELLTGMHGKLKDLACSEANGACTISGALNQEAADEFSGAKRIKEMVAGGGFGGAGGGAAGGAAGGGGGEITASGTASITFDAAGMPTQIVIETTMTTARGDSKRKQSYTLKAFGATTIEVPKDAAAKLAG